MPFFTRKFTKTDAFFVSLSTLFFLVMSLILAIGNYLRMTTAIGLAHTQSKQLELCLDHAQNMDAWWIGKWLIALVMTPVFSRIYYTNIKQPR